jgi:hypothetical protein
MSHSMLEETSELGVAYTTLNRRSLAQRWEHVNMQTGGLLHWAWTGGNFSLAGDPMQSSPSPKAENKKDHDRRAAHGRVSVDSDDKDGASPGSEDASGGAGAEVGTSRGASEGGSPPNRAQTRLTKDQAIAVYLAGLGPKSRTRASKIAAEFGVTSKTIRDVWTRKTWVTETMPLWNMTCSNNFLPPACLSSSPSQQALAAAKRIRHALGTCEK